MNKQKYTIPAIEVMQMKPEGFLCLSIPIGQGGGPGGGGDAKGGFFEEEEPVTDEETNIASYTAWEQ